MGPVPTSVKVVSILGIVYSALGLIGTPCGVLLTYFPLTPNPGMERLTHDPVYMTHYAISMAIHFVLSLILLSGSIGSLKLKPSGRTSMLVYAWGLIICTPISTILSVIFILPKMNDAMTDPHLPPHFAAIVGATSMAFGVLVAGAIAGVILYFFTRPNAVNAFKGIFPAAPTDFPEEFPADSAGQ